MSLPIEKLDQFKNTANNFIYTNRNLYNLNLKKKTKNLTLRCQNLIENYDNLSDKNLKNYYNLKDSSAEFFKNYFNYLKNIEKKNKRIKDKTIFGPFSDLVIEYKNMGYKIPSLSLNHNLFNTSLLLDDSKIKHYFETKKFGEKEEKQYEYIKKVEYFVNAFDEDFQIRNKNKNINISNNKNENVEKKKLKIENIEYIKPVFHFINGIKKNMNKKNNNNNVNNSNKNLISINKNKIENKNEKKKIYGYNEKKLIENRTNQIKNRNIIKLKGDLLNNSSNKNFSTNFTERNSLPIINNKTNSKKKVKFISQEDTTINTNNNTINVSFPLNQKSLLKKNNNNFNNNNNINISLKKKPSIWDENEELKNYNNSIEETISNFEIERLHNLMKLQKNKFPRSTRGKNTFKLSNKKSLDKKDSNKNIRIKMKRGISHIISSKNNINLNNNNNEDEISFINENNYEIKSTRNKTISNFFNYKKNLEKKFDNKKNLFINYENNIFNFNNESENNNLTEKEKKMNEIIKSSEINDFLTVISQTKKNILNYDGLNRLINSKKIKGAEKSKINLNKIKKLDKIILNFDKDLIYNYERIKKEE
jgi:hypothetical protein